MTDLTRPRFSPPPAPVRPKKKKNRPQYTLKTRPHQVIENMNTRSYIEQIKREVIENLKSIEHAPGVQMSEVPPENYIPEMNDDLEEDENPDERLGQYAMDRNIKRDDEFYDVY